VRVPAEPFCEPAQRALLRTIPCAAGVSRVCFDADVVVVAPRTGHVDSPSLLLTLRPRGLSLDVHALRRYLNAFAARTLEHEELAVAIACDTATVCRCRVWVELTFVVDETMQRTVRALGRVVTHDGRANGGRAP